ncbi:MAG: sigma-54-dependent Fis family transcriptional regulator [Myxococcales bacterium]|nr:sigma-54-dependent Fis family transcriptional regulator [Myxococcales bacterium]
MRRPKLLVVDDEDRYVELLHARLREARYATRCELPGPCWECEVREGCTLTHAHDWAEVEQALARHDDVDVVLLDLRFDLPRSRLLPMEGDARARQGLAILARLRARRPSLPVVLMTSADDLDLDELAPLDADEHLTLAGEDAYDARALGLLVARAVARREGPTEGGGYVWGASPAMQRLRRDAEVLARTSLPTLLRGEPGTGKSALAERVIHAASGRAGRFVAVDLGALPPSLAAAELFGTARGAFSGALDRPGRFEEAQGGTLFLDEIGELSLEAQALLLHALQERQVVRLGENRPRAVDVKLVAATNVDLDARVAAGTFRRDLLARLNPAAQLTLPPLRERRDDVLTLASAALERLFARPGPDRSLLEDYARAAGLEGAHARLVALSKGDRAPTASRDGVTFVLSRASAQLLREHGWPGNVRELELLVGNAALLSLADAMAALVPPTRSSLGASAARDADLTRRPPRMGSGLGAGEPPLGGVIPLPARLVRDLVSRGWPAAAAQGPGELTPRAQLRDVARDLERALFERLYAETDGDFEAMAARLLDGDATANARRVRLRFNQLGLKVRG